MADKVSVDPDSNHLTAVEDGKFEEEVRVKLPAKGVIPTIDVYFLTDATGSMGDVIKEVNNHSQEIVDGLKEKAKSVGADIRFGAGNYTDFDVNHGTKGFEHQESLTYDYDKVKAAIANWSTFSNGTTAEQQLYALDWLAQPAKGAAGWRADAKRIVLWFGDAPGHDPIPQSTSGEKHDISTSSVVNKLQQQDIFVLAFDTTGSGGSSSPGLDTDPDDHGNIGSGAEPGQASKIAGATKGQFAPSVKVNEVVQKILDIGGAAITEIRDLKLVPSPSIRPFMGMRQEFAPAGGDRTLQGGEPHEVPFDVPFAGLSQARGKPPETSPRKVTGELEVFVDGSYSGKKKVDIAVPDLSGTYRIQNTLSEYFLETDPKYAKNGGLVHQGAASDGDHQKWELIPVSGGGYNIKNKDTGIDRYVEVKSQSAENDAEILTSDNPGGKHKQWQFIPTGADEQGHLIFRIENVNAKERSGKKMVLDVKSNPKPENAKFVLWGYWGDIKWHKVHQEHFRLIPV